MSSRLRGILDDALTFYPGEGRVYSFDTVEAAGVFLRQLSAQLAAACKSSRRLDPTVDANPWPGVRWRRAPDNPMAVIVEKEDLPWKITNVVRQKDGTVLEVEKLPSEVDREKDEAWSGGLDVGDEG